ncbi:MAG: glycosyltransferase family 4 protein [Actinobacteria bacterium]|nr:glycosyltransferase family 4 protein [Actinomycetota bacterium]
MRIVLVSPYDMDVPGGVQSHVAHLASELRRGGDEVRVVAPGTRSRGGLVAVGGSVRIPFNDSVAPIALDPRVLRRTRDAVAAFAPDVVHVHEPAVPWVALSASLAGVAPTVGTYHAWSDRDRAYRAARPMLRRVARRLDALIAVSDAAADYHSRALGIPERDFRIIPNAVDVDRFARALPIPGDLPPTLLFVGRLERRKGLEQLIRAMMILKPERPDVRLLIVGEGPERDRCQEMIPARLRSDVVFLGRVDLDDLPRFYRSADLFVSPALGGESFGIVLLEAMAAGTPVVASDIPGYRSVLRHELHGRLVPPGDPRALADAILTLLDNPALRGAMGREAQAAVRDYDWAAVTARLRSLYVSVADGPSRRSAAGAD